MLIFPQTRKYHWLTLVLQESSTSNIVGVLQFSTFCSSASRKFCKNNKSDIFIIHSFNSLSNSTGYWEIVWNYWSSLKRSFLFPWIFLVIHVKCTITAVHGRSFVRRIHFHNLCSCTSLITIYSLFDQTQQFREIVFCFMLLWRQLIVCGRAMTKGLTKECLPTCWSEWNESVFSALFVKSL